MAFMTFHILGMSWSQLTHIFQRGRLNHHPENLHRATAGPAGMAQLKSSWDRRSIGPIHPSAGTSGTNTCSTRNPRKRTSRMPKKWHRRQKMIRYFGSLWLEQVWNHSPLAANYRLAAGSLPGVRHMLSVPVPQDGEGISVAAIGKLHSEAPAVQKCSNAQPQMIKWCGPKNWNITQCASTLSHLIQYRHAQIQPRSTSFDHCWAVRGPTARPGWWCLGDPKTWSYSKTGRAKMPGNNPRMIGLINPILILGHSYMEFTNGDIIYCKLIGTDWDDFPHVWDGFSTSIRSNLYLVGGLEHGFFDFPYIGNVIIPTDELIFFRGVGSTTNQ